MRKLLISMAKAEMERRGYAKVNRLMSEGRWREVLGVYPGFTGSEASAPRLPATDPHLPCASWPLPWRCRRKVILW